MDVLEAGVRAPSWPLFLLFVFSLLVSISVWFAVALGETLDELGRCLPGIQPAASAAALASWTTHAGGGGARQPGCSQGTQEPMEGVPRAVSSLSAFGLMYCELDYRGI